MVVVILQIDVVVVRIVVVRAARRVVGDPRRRRLLGHQPQLVEVRALIRVAFSGELKLSRGDPRARVVRGASSAGSDTCT